MLTTAGILEAMSMRLALGCVAVSAAPAFGAALIELQRFGRKEMVRRTDRRVHRTRSYSGPSQRSSHHHPPASSMVGHTGIPNPLYGPGSGVPTKCP